MNKNDKMIEILLNIYDHESLIIHQMDFNESLGYKDKNKDEYNKARKKRDATRNDIINWCNNGDLQK